MSTQLNIFDICANYHKGNANSVAANEFIAPKKQAIQQRIYDYITSQGKRGATCHEVCNALGIKWQTAGARMSEMKRSENELRIFWNGQKRATDGSQPASVFVTSRGQISG